MQLRICTDPDSVAQEAAIWIAAAARAAIAARGRFVIAVSGGRTPWLMLRALWREDVPWEGLHIVQVDERIAPAGNPDRNLTHLYESLLGHTALRQDQVHGMRVEDSDSELAAEQYSLMLHRIAGSPPVLDLVHLGLGSDGHTASLIPGDPVLRVLDKDVAITGMYKGRRRMTLTYPVLNRSRQVLWLVTGHDKAEMLRRLLAGDMSIPAGSVRRQDALILADRGAADEACVPTK